MTNNVCTFCKSTTCAANWNCCLDCGREWVRGALHRLWVSAKQSGDWRQFIAALETADALEAEVRKFCIEQSLGIKNLVAHFGPYAGAHKNTATDSVYTTWNAARKNAEDKLAAFRAGTSNQQDFEYAVTALLRAGLRAAVTA